MSTLTAKRSLVTHLDPYSPISDTFRTLRNMVGSQTGGTDRKIVTVISAEPSEGKTTVAVNLAIAYAQAGKKVLLIDGNLRQPGLDQIFSVSNQTGLSNVLLHTASLGDCVKDAGIPLLSVLTSGPAPAYAGDLLDSTAMESLLAQARADYDLVVIDSPALLALADAATLAMKSDGVLWVLHSRISRKAKALETKTLLQRLDVKIIGCVLNQTKREQTKAYRQYKFPHGV
ncbi:polysaccharide biosynthesis tyrosine autokinase [Cohnella sp. CFH 77786]|uniref:CpsD/CapB family tyrosine-protein kinase n=1 Tax=Cohnella sp. CFH 77786 TaxID=2662265 RepID=UPI001C608D23|nr:CpsD/CapB family tyrosine-protein kinase [Cohnella sp. CFH 77786]MBW5448382.1 polysaccharide biosynthesis tyrosine autokinase [Cohnella sp. CFH 77786]